MKLKPEILFLLVFMLTVFGITVNVVKNKHVNRGDNGRYINEITNRLNNVLATYDADRVILYKFSEYDETKVGFIKHKKLSCYAESTSNGTEPICYMHQNIPTLLMAGNFKFFDTVDTLFVPNINKVKNPSIKYMMNMVNAKSMYSVLIRNNNNIGVGLLTMQFIDRPKYYKNLDKLMNTSEGIKYLFLNGEI